MLDKLRVMINQHLVKFRPSIFHQSPALNNFFYGVHIIILHKCSVHYYICIVDKEHWRISLHCYYTKL